MNYLVSLYICVVVSLYICVVVSPFKSTLHEFKNDYMLRLTTNSMKKKNKNKNNNNNNKVKIRLKFEIKINHIFHEIKTQIFPASYQ